MKTGITVIILTYNEEVHIARAISSVKSVAEKVYVVDSFSSDRTREIAEAEGATVVQNKFVNYAKQFDWALHNCEIDTRWTMRLDADEYLSSELQAEIKEKLPTIERGVSGINIKRKHIFMGKWVRFGGRYPLVLLRIWRTGKGRIEQRWMDEHIVVSDGDVITFKYSFSDENMNDLTFFTDKHNKYATREAIDVLIRKYNLSTMDESLDVTSSSIQAAVKRIFKERFYNHLPIWLGPSMYFLYRYICQFGFLDGRTGLIYHALQGGWYRFLVAAKVYEYEKTLTLCADNDARLRALQALTGYRIG